MLVADEDVIERAGELGVAVTDEEPERAGRYPRQPACVGASSCTFSDRRAQTCNWRVRVKFWYIIRISLMCRRLVIARPAALR
jgi:hypothetical protein